MSEDYLWDGSGEDPAVERIEGALRPLAYDADRRPLALPPRRRRLPLLPLAAAAAVLAALGAWVASRPGGGAFSVETGGRTFLAAEGAWVSEVASERLIRLGDAGDVRAEPGARVKVVRIREEEHRLRLEFGTIHARIAADVRPGFFKVETPAATCVDLGCAYTLTVDGEGRSLVRVETGRVSFEDGNREVFVPAAAECRAEPGRGAGTPRFADAPERFAEAAAAFDAATGPARAAAAQALAAGTTRARDTLTLWHLLQDGDREVRAAAAAGIGRFEPAPEGFPAGAAVSGAPGAVEAWRSRLEPHWY